MLELRVSKKKWKMVRFATPGTYINGENFAEAAARGLFENIKKTPSRDKFYLATAIAVMIALEGEYNAQLSYGRFCGEYAAWVEVEFDKEIYILNPVEFRDMAMRKADLASLPKSAGLTAKWTCNYKEVSRHPAVQEITEAMSAAETSENVMPVIAAVRILD
ncbi:hypothetical protein IJJ18_02375 [Candidatus Saccharibacteria bacterium]|nr:hypothetical protein [Candidatus Saccharibacteria bacterium]